MTYVPIPVAVAQQIGDGNEKDIVLIVGWDSESNRTTITTWGRELGQKVAAAKAGETIAKQLGLTDNLADVHEDFRLEGEAAQVVDELRRRLAGVRDALAKIVVSEGQDAGVILLSSDSPTHYDAAAKCQVYEFEHFSPLGDALVAVAQLASESVPSPDNGQGSTGGGR